MSGQVSSSTPPPPLKFGMGGGGGGGHGGRMLVAKPKNFKKTFLRLMQYLKPYRLGLSMAILTTILATLFRTLGPRIMGFATNEIARGSMTLFHQDGVGIDFLKVGQILAVLGAVYILSSLFQYLVQYVMVQVSQKTMYDLRRAVDEKLRKLPLRYYDSHSFGDILSRVTNDVDTVSDSLQQSLTQIFSSVLSIVTILIMMLLISPLMTLVGLLIVPVAFAFSSQVVKRSQKFYRGQQNALGRLNGHVEEMYTGHSVIKVFGREEEVVERFDSINQELRDYAWKSQFISSVIQPCINFLSNAGYAIVTVIGGWLVLRGQILVGDVQSFVQYLKQFTQPINQTASIVNVLQSTVAAAERIFEVLDEPEEVPEADPVTPLSAVGGQVDFDHVGFGYNEERTLIGDLSIHVKPGERIAIVGPTGAGKTTLVNLLLRFYDVRKGAIRVDGVDLRQASRKELRSQFGMVLQDTWLFAGTVRENIRYGRLAATDEEVEQAAKLAYANRFITQLPGGYDFDLGEEGANISQGQRQLLTIARAILSNPVILILDEATSSVDTRTEVLIQRAMDNLMKNRTSFVIAHRLSTIRDADTILVLKDGDIVESGTHPALLEKGGFYAQLYNSQFTQNNLVEAPVEAVEPILA